MALKTINLIEAHSSKGVYRVDLTYDAHSRQITSLKVVNNTGDTQPLTISTHKVQGDITDQANGDLDMNVHSLFMIVTQRGIRAPLFIG